MNDSIKKIANDAKKRLQSGYWEELYKNREEDILCAKEKGVSEEFVHGIYKTRHAFSGEEDRGQIYSLIREIVEEEQSLPVLNPIGRLIDKDEFNSLCDSDKQRYVFDLSKTYLEIKREIEAEMKLKSLKG